MATRWARFYQKELQDKKLKARVEEELASLRVGAQVARLRAEEGLSQTQLAARAGMATPKISVIENRPQNMELSTLVRIARAANRRLEIRFTRLRSGRARNALGRLVARRTDPGTRTSARN